MLDDNEVLDEGSSLDELKERLLETISDEDEKLEVDALTNSLTLDEVVEDSRLDGSEIELAVVELVDEDGKGTMTSQLLRIKTGMTNKKCKVDRFIRSSFLVWILHF